MPCLQKEKNVKTKGHPEFLPMVSSVGNPNDSENTQSLLSGISKRRVTVG